MKKKENSVNLSSLLMQAISIVSPMIGAGMALLLRFKELVKEELEKPGYLFDAATRVLERALPEADDSTRSLIQHELDGFKSAMKKSRPDGGDSDTVRQAYEKAAIIFVLGFDIKEPVFQRSCAHYQELNPEMTEVAMRYIREARKAHLREAVDDGQKSYFEEVLHWLKTTPGAVQTAEEKYGTRIVPWKGTYADSVKAGAAFLPTKFLSNPFKERPELEKLDAWANRDGTPLCLVHGAAGAGKTRTAVELSRQIRKPVLFMNKEVTLRDTGISHIISIVRELPIPPVLVLDYAASHPFLPHVQEFLTQCPESKILLLERTHNLSSLERYLSEIPSKSQEKIPLDPLEPEDLLEIARDWAGKPEMVFLTALGKQIDRPLLAVIFGYLAGVDQSDAISDVCNMLRRFSHQLYQDYDNQENACRENPARDCGSELSIRDIVTQAILRDGIPEDDADKLLGDRKTELKQWGLYRSDEEFRGIVSLEPDLVAESCLLFNVLLPHNALCSGNTEPDDVFKKFRKKVLELRPEHRLAPVRLVPGLADLLGLVGLDQYMEPLLRAGWEVIDKYIDLSALTPTDAMLVELLKELTDRVARTTDCPAAAALEKVARRMNRQWGETTTWISGTAYKLVGAILGSSEVLSRRDKETAKALLEKSRETGGTENWIDAITHNNLANLLADHFGEHKEALNHYKKALALNPDDPGAHNNLALLLTKHFGEHKEALNHYKKALALNPEYSGAHNNLALLLTNHFGEYKDAWEHYQKALALNPEYSGAHNNLALLLTKHFGEHKEALLHAGHAFVGFQRTGSPHTRISCQLVSHLLSLVGKEEGRNILQRVHEEWEALVQRFTFMESMKQLTADAIREGRSGQPGKAAAWLAERVREMSSQTETDRETVGLYHYLNFLLAVARGEKTDHLQAAVQDHWMALFRVISQSDPGPTD